MNDLVLEISKTWNKILLNSTNATEDLSLVGQDISQFFNAEMLLN